MPGEYFLPKTPAPARWTPLYGSSLFLGGVVVVVVVCHNLWHTFTGLGCIFSYCYWSQDTDYLLNFLYIVVTILHTIPLLDNLQLIVVHVLCVWCHQICYSTLTCLIKEAKMFRKGYNFKQDEQSLGLWNNTKIKVFALHAANAQFDLLSLICSPKHHRAQS